jgi:uncharacterized phage protein (TIGR02216 family)
MHAGLGLLRLSPCDFWAMTPREFQAAAGAFAGSAERAPGRADLARLMAAYPDTKARNHRHGG